MSCNVHAMTLPPRSCKRRQEAAGIGYSWCRSWSSCHKLLLCAASRGKCVAGTAHSGYSRGHTAASWTQIGDRHHRQLRWRPFMKRQQAYSAICRTISGSNNDTVVAYGDAKYSSRCCKGNPSTPTVSLLRNGCQVFDIDKFRTSKLCYACKTSVNGMPLPFLCDPYTSLLPADVS